MLRRFFYQVTAVLSLVGGLAATFQAEFVTHQMQGALLFILCGVFCLADEVAAMRQGQPPPPKPKEIINPLAKPPAYRG